MSASLTKIMFLLQVGKHKNKNAEDLEGGKITKIDITNTLNGALKTEPSFSSYGISRELILYTHTHTHTRLLKTVPAAIK